MKQFGPMIGPLSLWTTVQVNVRTTSGVRGWAQTVFLGKVWATKSEVMILTFMFGRTFMAFWSQEVRECVDLIIKLRYPFRFFDLKMTFKSSTIWRNDFKYPQISIKLFFLNFSFWNSRELDDIWEYLTMRPSNNRKIELNKNEYPSNP